MLLHLREKYDTFYSTAFSLAAVFTNYFAGFGWTHKSRHELVKYDALLEFKSSWCDRKKFVSLFGLKEMFLLICSQ